MRRMLGCASAASVLSGLLGVASGAAEALPVLTGRPAVVVIAVRGSRDEEYAAVATAHVVVYGRLVTADGPASGQAFAKALVRQLSDLSRKDR